MVVSIAQLNSNARKMIKIMEVPFKVSLLFVNPFCPTDGNSKNKVYREQEIISYA